MKKMSEGFTLATLKIMAGLPNINYSIKSAVMTLKDGSRMTSTLHIFDDSENDVVYLNISDSISLQGTHKEFDEYIAKKFEIYRSDKEMYKDFCEMDEETWNAWNAEN